ncbi:MAG: helix-turn-helix domain-containing protein [Saprospiraceae bacterium]
MAKTQLEKILLGLKVRQFRQEKKWNFEEMSKQTGISVSYLNEIEKGKKYPQPANIQKLASALDITPAFLCSPELTKQFAPLGDLLKSNFLNELPLDLFGIGLQQVVDIIARAPDKVNAFISALLEIARNYSLRDEHFFFAALRAYQELRLNYFEEIEEQAEHFIDTYQLPDNGGVPANLLSDILKRQFGYSIDEEGMGQYPELQSIRAIHLPEQDKLLLNPRLNEKQKAFQLAKELGFQILRLKERPHTSSLVKVHSFEEALNNYKAAYFAVATLINRHAFGKDLTSFFSNSRWDRQFLVQLMGKYQASPEVLFQRFNILSPSFNLSKIFFLRMIHDLDRDGFDIDKELHLNRRHQPHASGLNEHYCRRWLSASLLREIQEEQLKTGRPGQPISGVQRALFVDTDEEYLCIALAKPGYPTRNKNVCVTIGILLDETAKNTIQFWDDPAIPQVLVNVTCERCALTNCRERASEPIVIQKRETRRKMLEALDQLGNQNDL